MKIFIIRHGETSWNSKLLIQGLKDNPLNESGEAQSLHIKSFLVNQKIDYVYSSPLKRAYKTATLALDNPQIIINNYFSERDFGQLEGQDVKVFYETSNKSNLKNYEDDQTLLSRIKLGLNNLYANHQEDDTIAIFTHAHVLKSILILIDKLTYSYSTKIKNCAILEVEYINNKLLFKAIH